MEGASAQGALSTYCLPSIQMLGINGGLYPCPAGVYPPCCANNFIVAKCDAFKRAAPVEEVAQLSISPQSKPTDAAQARASSGIDSLVPYVTPSMPLHDVML